MIDTPEIVELRIRVDRADYGAADHLAIFGEDKHGNSYMARLTWERIAKSVHADPTLSICRQRGGKTPLQELVDDLWRAGIRPVDAAGSAGQLDATQHHLQDMRQIAFKVLGVDKP
jgi:hypothetical protein